MAFRALDTGVIRVLKGGRFLGVYGVAGIGTKGDAVGILPRLDANNTQHKKA